MSSQGRHDDSRRHGSYSRRDSPSRSRSSRDSRRSSPGPSRGRSPPPSPRDDNDLPTEFGRMGDFAKDDENNVLRRMKTAFTKSPLGAINDDILQIRKIKVWTRNFKEVRGICTGFVVVFDKHWNLVMSDVDEVFLRPKKAKTPFLQERSTGDAMPELKPKVPKVKKERPPDEVQPVPKSKKVKKKGRKINKRHMKQVFIRGDNIVMMALLTLEEERLLEQAEKEAAEKD